MKETKKYANTTAKTKELHLTAKSQGYCTTFAFESSVSSTTQIE